MGFFSVLGRLAKGQQPFQVNQPKQQNAPAQPAPTVPQPRPAPTGPKVYPKVIIERVECRTPGNDMGIEVGIYNHSQGQIELDKFELFGRTQDLGTFLRPGEEREFNVYHGPRLRATNQSNCRVYYKDQSGDYFASDHYIEFRQQADGTYSVDRMRFLRVVDV